MGKNLTLAKFDKLGQCFLSVSFCAQMLQGPTQCATEGKPGVYARVSEAYEWIQGQICALSENPPKECPGEGKARLRIDIHYDRFPNDTGWTLENSNGGQVAGSRRGSDEDAEVIVSTYVDASPGVYEFEITDSFDDGLSVPHGAFHPCLDVPRSLHLN
jgi:hypothetical protein